MIPPTQIVRIRGTGEDMDAANLWLEAVIHGFIPDYDKAENFRRSLPGLLGLLLYKTAVDNAPHA